MNRLNIAPGFSSDDIIVYPYPCFRYKELLKTLHRITSKLGFHAEDVLTTPYVFSYINESARLVVMTTPAKFNNETMCYAIQGTLLVTKQNTSNSPYARQAMVWRKNPLHFYDNLVYALKLVYPNLLEHNNPTPQITHQSSIGCLLIAA